jgi:hypothetical protein
MPMADLVVVDDDTSSTIHACSGKSRFCFIFSVLAGLRAQPRSLLATHHNSEGQMKCQSERRRKIFADEEKVGRPFGSVRSESLVIG